MIEKRKSREVEKVFGRDKPDSMNVVYDIHWKNPFVYLITGSKNEIKVKVLNILDENHFRENLESSFLRKTI
jgi:hypothetical protein